MAWHLLTADPVQRDFHRLSDCVHNHRGRSRRRLLRAGSHRAASHDDPVLLGDEGNVAGLGALFPVHGLPAGAVGPHGTIVPRHPAAPGRRQRFALHRRAGDCDHLRRGHRHRRIVGHAARRHGGAEHEEKRLRRAPVGWRHHRRRHARHPDSALSDADRNGAGGRRTDDRPVCCRRHSGARAGRRCTSSMRGPQLHRPLARSGDTRGRPAGLHGRDPDGTDARRRAGGGRHPGNAGRDLGRHRHADGCRRMSGRSSFS